MLLLAVQFYYYFGLLALFGEINPTFFELKLEISDKYNWPLNFPEKQVIFLFDILLPDFLILPIPKTSGKIIGTKKITTKL